MRLVVRPWRQEDTAALLGLGTPPHPSALVRMSSPWRKARHVGIWLTWRTETFYALDVRGVTKEPVREEELSIVLAVKEDVWRTMTGLRAGDVIEGEIVQLIELHSITISAKNRESYDRCDEPAFPSALIRAAPLVCRGEVLYLPDQELEWEFDVIDCTPVQRGVVVSTTDVVVLRPPQPITVPAMIRRLSTGDSGRFSIPSSSTTTGLALALLASPLPQRVLQPPPEKPRDVHIECGVTTRTLRRSRLFSSSWVLVTPVTGGRPHLARVFAVDPPATDGGGSVLRIPWEDDTLYLAPTLLFNLGLADRPATRVMVTPFQVEAGSGTPTKHTCLPSFGFYSTQPPPFAERVTVARVASPRSSGRASYAAALGRFFDTPRILSVGDVITVPLVEGEADQDSELDAVVFFGVSSVAPKEYSHFRVNRANTTLIQEGLMHTRVPRHATSFDVHMEATCKDFICQTGVVDGVPGLESVTLRLLSLLSPFLCLPPSALGLSCGILLCGPRGCGKEMIVKTVAHHFGVHLVERNAHDLLGNTEKQTVTNIERLFDTALASAPCILFLRQIGTLGRAYNAQNNLEEDPSSSIALRKNLSRVQSTEHPILFIATEESAERLPAPLKNCFTQELTIDPPDMPARERILRHSLHPDRVALDLDLSSVAQQTAGKVWHDLRSLVAEASVNAIRRALAAKTPEEHQLGDTDVQAAGVVISSEDFTSALAVLQSSSVATLAAPRIPHIAWEDIGGLARVKAEILDTIQLPLQYPQLFSSGMRQRTGVLLYGPPGTGKTLLAKAVATECALNFFSVKGPELINMYVGESERNVREVFARARAARPCVVFFDELDALAPHRGRGADSGGVMDRVVSQLLAELDGLQKNADVFAMAATNRPDLVDSSLLRPGRFDRLLYVGMSEDVENHVKILEALTRKFRLAEDVDLHAIAAECPRRFTGADMFALCSDAMLNGIKRKIAVLEEGMESLEPRKVIAMMNDLPSEELSVVVQAEDFVQALQGISPSVSEDELAYYRNIQASFTQQKSP